MKKRTSATRLARQLGIPKGRGLEAVVKARLIAAIFEAAGLEADIRVTRAA
jgi:hypothetical protein